MKGVSQTRKNAFWGPKYEHQMAKKIVAWLQGAGALPAEILLL